MGVYDPGPDVGVILTWREREVIQVRAGSHGYRETARNLGLSVDTVKTHLYIARLKLRARDTAHLCALCYSRGLIH